MITVTSRDVMNEIKSFTEHAKDEFAFTFEKQEEQQIKAALRRYAAIDTNLVDVVVDNDTVVINGLVKNKAQKEDAENIAYITLQGITKVENNLNVDVEYAGAEVYEF